MTKNEYAKVMQFLEAAYPTKSIFSKENVVDVWYECLKDLEPRRALEAVKEVSQTEEFPSIAKIRAVATRWKASVNNDKAYETGIIPQKKKPAIDWAAEWVEAEKRAAKEMEEIRNEQARTISDANKSAGRRGL